MALYVDCLGCRSNVNGKCINKSSPQYGCSMDGPKCGPYNRCGLRIPKYDEQRKVQKKKDLVKAAELLLKHVKSL
jgi:hypothetical protein